VNNQKSAEGIIIGAQLQKARKLLQFTVEEVAQEIQVSPQDISNWEKEEGRPNLEQLETLAKLYGREIDYFLRKTPDPPTGIEFRGKPGKSVKDLSKNTRIVLARFDDLCRAAVEFEDLLSKKPEVKLSSFKPSKNPNIDAQRLREKYKLENKPIINLRDLLEDNGVRIFELPIPDDELSGFSFWHSKYGPCILLNARDTKGRKNFTLAHELAHILYSDGSSLCFIPIKFSEIHENIEYTANQFTVEFLLPGQEIRNDFKKRNLSSTPTEAELSQIAYKWNVSIQALGYRLENLNLIKKGHTDTLLEAKPLRFRRPKTPAWERQLGKRFVETAIESYKKNLISVSKLSHVLRIPIRKAMEIAMGRGH
jgi:Zn-dependent peptidase ImmA (M78 family)/DNA-binding XRE family transcriptional regulator